MALRRGYLPQCIPRFPIQAGTLLIVLVCVLDKTAAGTSFKPIHLCLALHELRYLDSLPNLQRPLGDLLGDVAGEVRVLAELAGDDRDSHLDVFLFAVRCKAEFHEAGQDQLYRPPNHILGNHLVPAIQTTQLVIGLEVHRSY